MKLVKIKVVDSSIPYEYVQATTGIELGNGSVIIESSNNPGATWYANPNQVQVLGSSSTGSSDGGSLAGALGQEIKTLTVEFK